MFALERSEEHRERERREAPGKNADQAERASLRGYDGVNDLGRQDEDGIPRWVRLMLGDIEIANAQREVDGIEIFERDGKKREMERDEHQRKQAGPTTRYRAWAWQSPHLRAPL